jgi:hypothetical protein
MSDAKNQIADVVATKEFVAYVVPPRRLLSCMSLSVLMMFLVMTLFALCTPVAHASNGYIPCSGANTVGGAGTVLGTLKNVTDSTTGTVIAQGAICDLEQVDANQVLADEYWLELQSPPHVIGEPLGVEGVLGQKIQPLSFHRAATPAIYPPDLDLQVHPHITIGQVADSPRAPIVPTKMATSAGIADVFFPVA